MILVIGNKNYSSWSLRPWLAMTALGIPFTQKLILLDTPKFKSQIARYSKAGRVPVLLDGKTAVWDTLAIIEYLAERFPKKGVWPSNRLARARARSIVAEMHAGFGALRNACPMNLRRPPKPVPMSADVENDVARIETAWREARKAFGKGGPFLFGKFTAADAYYAPVVTRFETFAIPVAKDTRTYMDAVLAHPAFQNWKTAALKEKWIVPSDEVD